MDVQFNLMHPTLGSVVASSKQGNVRTFSTSCRLDFGKLRAIKIQSAGVIGKLRELLKANQLHNVFVRIDRQPAFTR